MRMLALAAAATVPVAWAACDAGDQEPPERPSFQALQDMPVYRPAATVAWQTGEGTVELIYHAEVVPDTVAAFFRRRFAAEGWTIVGDVTTPEGMTTLHVQRDDRRVWVLISLQPDGQGTEFTLIAAQPDTTDTTP